MKTLMHRPKSISRFFDNDEWDFPTGWFTKGPSGLRTMPELDLPKVNIKEGEKQFELDIAVPGFKKEDLKIEVNDGLLTVSSEREEEKNEEKAGWTRREYNYGSFTRSFQLPENTDGEHVTAKFTDGVLHLTVAKIKAVPERKAKHIAIS